jgi:hypothetical protein
MREKRTPRRTPKPAQRSTVAEDATTFPPLDSPSALDLTDEERQDLGQFAPLAPPAQTKPAA